MVPNGNYLHKSTLDIPETDNNFRHEMKSLARYLWNFIEDHEYWQPLLNRYTSGLEQLRMAVTDNLLWSKL